VKAEGSVPGAAILLFLGIALLLRLASRYATPYVPLQPDILAAALFLYAPLLHSRRGRPPAWVRVGDAQASVRAGIALAAAGGLAYFLYTLLPLPPSLAPYRGERTPLGELLFRQGLLVALPEEVFFRGYLYDAFEEKGGAPILSSSLLFAAGHLIIYASPYRALTFFPGLLLAAGRRISGNIYVPIALHLLFNLLPYFFGGSR